MKKIVSIVLVISLCIALASCTKDNKSESGSLGNEPLGVSESVSEPKAATELTGLEAAAENNLKIDENSIDLIQLKEPKEDDLAAVIETTAGSMLFVLYPDKAPLAVENFVAHAESGYYTDMSFYKAINNFFVETGAPEDTSPTSIYKDSDGNSIPFVTETDLDLWNFSGALIMKNKGADRPNSNTSEFRIIQAKNVSDEWLANMESVNYPKKVYDKYKEIGGIPGFDSRVTVFGQIVEGRDILDTIASAPVDSMYAPANPVSIVKITTGRYKKVLPLLDTEASLGDSGSSEESEKE